MNFPEVLPRIATSLDRAGIRYMLTGSFAAAHYGLLRSTRDIDLVIEATPAQLRTFVGSLSKEEYYAEAEAALDAEKRQSMFNVIDLTTGWKIDLIIRKSRSFSREEFGRRQLATFEGTPLFVASVEDVILAKLEWAKLGQSQRQIEDAAGIFKMRGSSVDLAYIEKWINDLQVMKEWDDARRISGVDDRPIPPLV